MTEANSKAVHFETIRCIRRSAELVKRLTAAQASIEQQVARSRQTIEESRTLLRVIRAAALTQPLSPLRQ